MDEILTEFEESEEETAEETEVNETESEAKNSDTDNSDVTVASVEPADENKFDRFEALRNQERVFNEYREFSELFPEARLDSLPDSVNDSVRAGVPLAAAYALYRYKKEATEKAASAINEKNRDKSFAVKKNDSSDSYFSPSEVKKMSPAEVKANYDKIIDSMSHWH